MSDDVKTRFSKFFSSPNFTGESDAMQEEIVALVSEFIKKGFRVWPEWRGAHSTHRNKVWTLKTVSERKANGNDNVITVYQMRTKLKVEVYYGQYDKRLFYFSSSDDNLELFEEASDNYRRVLGKSLVVK